MASFITALQPDYPALQLLLPSVDPNKFDFPGKAPSILCGTYDCYLNTSKSSKMKTVKHCLFIFVVTLGSILQTAAQTPTQTIRGLVADKDSKVPLIGANVVLLETSPILGASTNIDGQFQIDQVPLGRYVIKVSYVGYEEITIPEVSVGAGKEVVLNLELRELVNNLATVVVGPSKDIPLNSMATVSSRSFSVDEASRYAGSFSDPGRMASAFAGVVSNNSFTNEITVRGNSPRGLLWRLDGVEIPTPNHLSGYSSNGGVVTVLSTNAMSNSDFFTGAFPAEYGNATSGVFDIKLRKGNDQKREYAFQASLFGMEASAEGPLRKGSKASYLINYRYSTTSLFGDIGLLDKNDGLPTWQDLSFKLHLPTQRFGEFQLFGIGGLSNVDQAAQQDTLQWETDADNLNTQFHSNMGVVGLSHRIFLNDDTYLRTVVAMSGRGTGHRADSLDAQLQEYYYGKSDTRDITQTFSTMLNHKVNANNTLRAGLILDRKSFNLFAEDLSPVAPYEIRPLVDSKGHFYSIQSYVQWKYRVLDNVELNAGLHSFYTTFNKNGKTETRTSVRWEIDPRQSVSFGMGMHSRMEPATIYFEEIPSEGGNNYPNKQLETGISTQYVVSYDRNLTDNMRLKVEAYYQNQRHIPIEDNPNSSFSIINNERPVTGLALVNKGTATNKGLELTLEKFFDHNYYFLLTGSLYDAKYVAGDGIERNTRYNGNYVANLLVGKEFQLNDTRSIGLDFRFVVAGGNRTTPIDLEQSRLEGTTVYQDALAYSEQAPTYFRPDLKVSYTKNSHFGKQIFSIDIQNIANRQNLLNTYFDKRKNEVVKNYQFGMLPNVSYRLEF